MDRPEPLICHSLWGHDGDLDGAIARALALGFDGLEANLDHGALTAHEPRVVADRLQQEGLALIVEIVTGGDYVPALDSGPCASR